MSSGLITTLKKLYVVIRYTSYGSGLIGVSLMMYAKLTGSDEKLMTGMLFAGAMFILFLMSYFVYWFIRLLAKHHDAEQINP